jgi:hypothetical protein
VGESLKGRIRLALSGQRADEEERKKQRLSYKAEDATDRRGSTIAVLASAGKTRAQKEEEALE